MDVEEKPKKKKKTDGIIEIEIAFQLYFITVFITKLFTTLIIIILFGNGWIESLLWYLSNREKISNRFETLNP